MTTVEDLVFGFLWLFFLAWFFALNYVSFSTYVAMITARKGTLVSFLLAVLWQAVSLIPLVLAILCHNRIHISVPT